MIFMGGSFSHTVLKQAQSGDFRVQDDFGGSVLVTPPAPALIESYGSAYNTLVTALQAFPAEMWQWRALPNTWTIHEIIVHITDSEANSYARCRRCIAEPGSTVWRTMKWAGHGR
ncbi:MAG: DinB family protein [Chloroflexales bacterium]|nr:DinB family protein [Chloroflexales bacterium]